MTWSRLDPALPPPVLCSLKMRGSPVTSHMTSLMLSIRRATLLTVRQCLVDEMADSERRPLRRHGWIRHRREIEEFGATYATLVNGSFCTSDLRPSFRRLRLKAQLRAGPLPIAGWRQPIEPRIRAGLQHLR